MVFFSKSTLLLLIGQKLKFSIPLGDKLAIRCTLLHLIQKSRLREVFLYIFVVRFGRNGLYFLLMKIALQPCEQENTVQSPLINL